MTYNVEPFPDRASYSNAPWSSTIFGSWSNVLRRIANRVVPDVAGSTPASTSTMVEPFADRPTGVGSGPIVGSRQAPSILWLRSPKPGCTVRSWTTVDVPWIVASMRWPQVLSGMPVGSVYNRSLVLARMTSSVSSPDRPTTSHASEASSMRGADASGAAIDATAGLDPADGAGSVASGVGGTLPVQATATSAMREPAIRLDERADE